IYMGPIAPTLRRLKIFSLSSLTLSFGFIPFLFIVESSLPFAARATLAGVAMATTSVSTALVAWCTRPYVVSLRQLASQDVAELGGIEMTTLTLGLNERRTRVYDTAFLVDSRRPLSKWELAKTVVIPDASSAGVVPGTEETVAETYADGGVIGRWIVRWGEDGNGTCRQEGKMIR
ncbi:hypothetical protein PUNSTDRAFT_39288, partial [Punctularia strigosozonata HHB-11173 SS5]|uniref:uncharacterized protein n=1 Tax=Punctularia strigosozonata (strain HHB-11173) TaxID=741275 RepID=UPI0004416D98